MKHGIRMMKNEVPEIEMKYLHSLIDVGHVKETRPFLAFLKG